MIDRLPRRPEYADPLSGQEPDPKYMTWVEHLDELRRRLIVGILAIALGSVAGWFLAPATIHLIDAPLRASLHGQGRLVVNTIYGGFTLQLKVAITVGFALALPVTFFQLWGFVAPAFGPAASRYGPIFIGSGLGLFAAGATTGFLVIPLAISFFVKFQSSDLQLLPFASEYVSFVALILVVFGISFELPLVLVSLTALGITSSRWLASKRIAAFFACFVFATVVTPGADWVSPLILGGILYVLFELSIVISRLLGK
jgi:sec-independent protein translocase protein TatC